VGLALEVLVDARHDAEHRRLARAVQAEQADLGARVERERDVLEDLALGRNDLAHANHRVDELGHMGRTAVLRRASKRQPERIQQKKWPAGYRAGQRQVPVALR
jgi:hypothetical protein